MLDLIKKSIRKKDLPLHIKKRPVKSNNILSAILIITIINRKKTKISIRTNIVGTWKLEDKNVPFQIVKAKLIDFLLC